VQKIMSDNQRAFTGSVPEFYQRNLVPMIFEPHARTLAAQMATLTTGRVLELAAGTGAVTRALLEALPAEVAIIATDLNEAMLTQAKFQVGAEHVEWHVADAMALPFPGGNFNAVVCGFGVMFFPDKRAAFSETLRVLAPRCPYVFTVWDRMDLSVLNETARKVIADIFVSNAPQRHLIPFSYCDKEVIRADLEAAGFVNVTIDIIAGLSRANSAYAAADGWFRGTNASNEIQAQGEGWLEKGIAATAAALTEKYGKGPLEMPNQALLVTATTRSDDGIGRQSNLQCPHCRSVREGRPTNVP
jgi:ubiquinone/menaquinone biosynthesis C-methylase UbiE